MAFALRSTRVVVGDTTRPATVLVDGETITAVSDHSSVVSVPVEDLGELVVSPGLVDTHVHINEPGRTDWEGFETATLAAAAGGVTTLVDMPLNCIPVTTNGAALETKLSAAEGQLSVDVGFWAGVVPGNASSLKSLADKGALGAKAFLCDSGIDDFPRVGESDLREAMKVLRSLGLPLLAHAEIDIGSPPNDHPPESYRAWLESRPHAWETTAIELLVRLCRETRCAVHVVHLSSAEAIEIIREAKSEGLPFTVETCAHYLCLRAEEVSDKNTLFKCAPPIREESNREKLWAGLIEGVIDFVVTDHSPCTPALKLGHTGDFIHAWGGIASLQLGLSSVWSEAIKYNISLETLSRWMAASPARFAGLSRSKGAIKVGHHADLVVWNPEESFTLTAEQLRFKNKQSPYVGKSLRGTVTATYLRGQKVFDARHPHNGVQTRQGRTLLGRDSAH